MSDDQCPNGCDLTGGPIPPEDQHLYGQTHYSRKIGIEVWGVYDGVLYWKCPDCGVTWNRWPQLHKLHAIAEEYMNG